MFRLSCRELFLNENPEKHFLKGFRYDLFGFICASFSGLNQAGKVAGNRTHSIGRGAVTAEKGRGKSDSLNLSRSIGRAELSTIDTFVYW